MSEAAAPRGRPRVQLALTVLALVLASGAYALVSLGRTGGITPDVPLVAGLLLAGYLSGHLLVRRLAPTADPVFFPVASLLTGLGFAMIYRLGPDLRTAPQNIALPQGIWMTVALVAFGLTLWLVKDHRQLDAFTYTIGLVGIALLLLPLVPGLGRTVNGAQLWVEIGPLRFQPSELGKVAVVVFLASYLNAKKEILQLAPGRLGPFQLPQARHLGPVLVAWGVSLVILFVQKDIGASLLYFGIFVLMLWLATARGAYLSLGIVLFAIGAVIGASQFGHVESRIDIRLHALDPQIVQDEGYQLAQAQFAMATGGIAGSGLGQGLPTYIPFAYTDFMFAALGEELGLFGSVGVLLLFVVLIGRGFRAALDQSEGFGKLLAAGLATVLGVQAFIIIGGVTRLIPLTGITLPFVSYGGSSLVANYVILALLIRTSAGPAPSLRAREGVGG
ncbi:MAG: FtsW/RodA/SpoVE family cell cycle protein [Actinobacteria bacterium]|nr:FtsW/RodA/SpoVE family cell cycle protein [Actinomycetota bacterium]